ncbi:MAG: mechanosensitive ion channel [Planctomycetales bacterium]|nr:mechanosensitive ion channel [Planctomycetales bacterium]
MDAKGRDMFRKISLYGVAWFLLVAIPTAPLNAQLPLPSLSGTSVPPDQAVAPATVEPTVDLKRQRQEISERLHVAQRQLDVEKEKDVVSQNAEVTESLSREVGNLKQLEVLLAQQQAAEERKAAAEKQKVELEMRVDQLRQRGPSEPRPYSFLLLDQLRDELVAESARKDAVQATVDTTAEAVRRAETVFGDKQRRRRKAKEALNVNKDDGARPQLLAAHAEAELDARLAEQVLKTRNIELTVEKLAQQTHELQLVYLAEKIELVDRDVHFTHEDLEHQLVELERQERDLKQSLQSAEATAQFLDQQWFDARARLDKAFDRSPALEEEVEARRLARLAQQQRITALGQRLARVEDRREGWQRRFKNGLGSASREDRLQWFEETEQKLEQLDRERRLETIRLDEVRKDQATLEARIDSDPQRPAETTRWLRSQQHTLLQLSNLHERQITSIDASRRLHDKLLVELRASQPVMTWFEQSRQAYEGLVQAWNYELASIDDRPITVKKIVMGVMLLFVGYLLSRVISRLFGGRFLPRVGVNPSAASALQTVLFYTLVVLFAVFALKIVNVPLTAFTLLGGAVALGIGFGSQNVVNNFISGLILLAERPIRVGDLIQVDGLFATVETIGARSTRVKTGSNLEIIVPNSKFLENNVTNWTLSDKMVRCEVSVGVAYGSPTESVEELLIKAAKLQEMVLVDPAPFVWFRDFGDSALQFQLNFWIYMTSLTRRMTIESQVRFKIDELFRASGVVISFPQRDIHLDAVRPLEVRVLPATESPSAAGEAAADKAA